MSSNLRASTWSLSARLLIGQVMLLAAVCLGIGAVTVVALYQYLVGEVDAQLRETAHRAAMMYGEPLPPPPPGSLQWQDDRPAYPRPGPGPQFLDAPGQPIGLAAGVVRDGVTTNAGVLTAGVCGLRCRRELSSNWPMRSAPATRSPVISTVWAVTG